MRDAINNILKFTQDLESLCRRELGTRSIRIRRDVETPRVRLSEIQNSYTDEDGFEYPESIEVKIENWSNSFYTFRIKDSRLIRENVQLDSTGISTFKLLKEMLREFKSWLDHIQLHEEARNSNCVVHDGELVVVENVDRDFFALHVENKRAVFDLIFKDGSTSSWYGYSPERAIENASPWLKENPVAIKLSHFQDKLGNKTSYRETLSLIEKGA